MKLSPRRLVLVLGLLAVGCGSSEKPPLDTGDLDAQLAAGKADARTNRTYIDGTVSYGVPAYGEFFPNDSYGTRYYTGWTFTGHAGDKVTLKLAADDGADGMLYLYGPERSTGWGYRIAWDDDSGPGTDPLIKDFTLPADGTYLAVTVEYYGDWATYTLRVDAQAASCRNPTVSSSDTHYHRFEAPSASNACNVDADCRVGGCSSEVCAAEPVYTTCELLSRRPTGSCGCVQGACRWFTVGACQ